CERVATDAPGATGASELATYDTGDCNVQHYFALKERTGAGVWSPMSNVVHTKVLCCLDPPCQINPAAGMLPRQLALDLESQTPCGGAGQFRIALPADARGKPVSLAILDVSGREVSRLLAQSAQPGYQTVRWDPTGSGGRAAQGVYFAHLRVGDQTLRRTIVM